MRLRISRTGSAFGNTWRHTSQAVASPLPPAIRQRPLHPLDAHLVEEDRLLDGPLGVLEDAPVSGEEGAKTPGPQLLKAGEVGR